MACMQLHGHTSAGNHKLIAERTYFTKMTGEIRSIQYTLTKSLRLSNVVIEKFKLRNVADLSIEKIHYCYFHAGNLQVIYYVKDFKIETCP